MILCLYRQSHEHNGLQMRIITLFISLIFLSGCAANLKLVDRTSGNEYAGTTGNTMGGEGTVNASVENSSYNGSFIYMANGGGFSLTSATATDGTATAYGQAMTTTVSARGQGMINMRSPEGKFIRCVFDFNTFSNKGIGECVRNDGRQYDLWIKR